MSRVALLPLTTTKMLTLFWDIKFTSNVTILQVSFLMNTGIVANDASSEDHIVFNRDIVHHNRVCDLDILSNEAVTSDH